MARKLLKINELKRVYDECNNSQKELIISDAINSIKALLVNPEVPHES